MDEAESPQVLGYDMIDCVKNGDIDRVRVLLERGADPRVSDEHGLTSVDHAQLMGHVAMFVELYHRQRAINIETLTQRFPALVDAFMAVPDFQVKLHWRVVSWVPFISAFCPGDTWTITKVGSRMRIDSHLANWNGFRWTEGSVSNFFDASADFLDSFVAVDNVSGSRVVIMREILAGDPGDVDEVLRLDFLKGFICAETVRGAASRRWFGLRAVAERVIDGFRAFPRDVPGLRVRFLHSEAPRYGHTHSREKTYSARFWLAPDYPLHPSMLVPFLEALAPFRSAPRNILALFGLLDDAMPVMGEVAVFPTVRFQFSLEGHRADVAELAEYVVLPAE